MTTPVTVRPGTTPAVAAESGWRTVDVVVASAIAVAFGVVFWGWNSVWEATKPAFAGFPPGQAVIYGVWMMPAVLGALVIRKRGAALLTELVAAIVSALLGAPWGLWVVLYGLVQGVGAEQAFALRLYRSWRLPTAMVAGALAGGGGALLDLVMYYSDWSGTWQLSYAALIMASSALVAGLGSWLLVRGLARTGVLAPFASGTDSAPRV